MTTEQQIKKLITEHEEMMAHNFARLGDLLVRIANAVESISCVLDRAEIISSSGRDSALAIIDKRSEEQH